LARNRQRLFAEEITMNRALPCSIPLVFMLFVTLAAQQAAPPQTTAADFQAFSRFDFVPGERVVGFEDFSQESIGDFPTKWNTNAAGEIVTVTGKPGRWLKLTRAGVFVPELTPTLPDNFTLEFDLLVPPTFNSGYLFNASIVQLDDVKQIQPWQTASNRFTFTAWAAGGPTWQTTMTTRLEANTTGGTTSGPATDTKSPWKSDPVHVAVTRQGARVRVYFNQEKMWDVPRALLPAAKYNAIVFFIPNVDSGSEYLVSNVRLAVGAPDTRNKLLTQGKWVTNGILFDVNSDRIRGESYGTLKEVAGVLAENADLKVQIVGHTDSDGEAAANLDLSRRRAASVKTTLVSEFKIDAARIDTDGKGENEPADKATTPAAKANNRRVEFIKK
jgi:outer membrane protein OmpA-like peptidoglycan-associated protein